MAAEIVNFRTALDRAHALIQSNPIFGMEARVEHNGSSLIVDYARGWGISAKLCIQFSTPAAGKPSKARVEVSWPSTNHSIASAQASIALFSQVTNLGALIQATLDQLEIRLG